MIGYFREIHLNFSRSNLFEVAKHYTQDDFQRYPTNPSNSCVCLGMVINCRRTSKRKQCSAATIKKVRPPLGKKKVPISMLNRFSKTCNKANSVNTCVLACADSHYKSEIV